MSEKSNIYEKTYELYGFSKFKLSSTDEMLLEILERYVNMDTFILFSPYSDVEMSFYELHGLSGFNKAEFVEIMRRMIKYRLLSLVKTRHKELILINPGLLGVEITKMSEVQKTMFETFFLGNNIPIVLDKAMMRNLITNRNHENGKL